MPRFRVNVTVTQRGPLFNVAKSKARAQSAVVQVNESLALEGVTRLRAYLDRNLQKPTGYYRSRVVVERRQIYRGITDSNVVYGGWLEGISTRNKASRFKGYRAFRTIKQELARDKAKIAATVITQLVKDLEG